MLVDFHDGSLVAASIAVIRRTEDGHHIAILAPIVSLHDKLMGARYQRQPVVVVECLADVLAKSIPGATRAYTPTAAVVRVAPEEITHGPFVGNFLDPVQAADVVEGVDARGQAAVQTEDLVVDQRGQGQVVEQVGEVFPHVGVAVFA